MEDDILLFCETREDAGYAQLVGQFGQPRDVAADFFSELDPKAVSRFAYIRLKAAYLLLTLAAAAALAVVIFSAVNYAETQQLVSGAYTAEAFLHPNGTECSTFLVRTNCNGDDVYWEYHSCIGHLVLGGSPDKVDGTEPYAVDIYLNNQGNIEHWTFSQKYTDWIRVYDET